MQCESLNPNTDTIDLNGELRPPLSDSDEPEPIPDLKNSVSMSLDNDPPQANRLFSPNPPRGPSGSPILYGNPTPTTRIPAKLC